MLGPWLRKSYAGEPEVEILLQKAWGYFPHFENEALVKEFPWKILDLQGKRNTIFIGARCGFSKRTKMDGMKVVEASNSVESRVESRGYLKRRNSAHLVVYHHLLKLPSGISPSLLFLRAHLRDPSGCQGLWLPAGLEAPRYALRVPWIKWPTTWCCSARWRHKTWQTWLTNLKGMEDCYLQQRFVHFVSYFF